MSSGMSTAVVRQGSFRASPLHKRCGKCGKLVSRSAFQCRRCGKRQRMSRKSLLLILSAGLMVAMFGAAALGGSGPPSAGWTAARAGGAPRDLGAAAAVSGTKAGRGSVGPADTRDAARMTAAELWLAYAEDGAAADRRFRGRPIVVSGTVRAIERDFDGRPVVRFSTDDPLDTVNAKLATREDLSLRDLGKGRPASLGCVGRGALFGAPLLSDCFVL
jgi:hypothetical protein